MGVLTRLVADNSLRTQEETAGDFRTRSAARRRQRMRLRLLEATMAACAQREEGAVVIDDVLRAAGVSRGTFYAHFDSLQDAINIVAQLWVDESMIVFDKMYPEATEPHVKAAVGPQLLFLQSIAQPAWGSTIVQAYGFLTQSPLIRANRADIIRGMRSGIYRRGDVQAAVDVFLGSMMQGMRTLRERRRERFAYIQSLCENLLLAMGVPEEKARETVAWAAADIRKRGPDYLEWWPEFLERSAD